MPLMLDDIREQPAVVARSISETGSVYMLGRKIKEREIRLFYIAARGTSDHAAHYAKYLFEIEHGIPVALAAPSTFTLYDRGPVFDANTCVIGISQSGAGPDVCAVVERARAMGALTAAITDTEGSLLAQTAEETIITPAGPEISVAATKTYTSALAVIARISVTLRGGSEPVEELGHLPEHIEGVLKVSDLLKELAAERADLADCVVIARGYNHPTAAEIALKLTETCAISAQAFSSADFRHGPVARVGEGSTCFLIAPSGHAFASMVESAELLETRGASVIVVTDRPAEFSSSVKTIPMPAGIPEWLSPIPYVVVGQLFACHLSLAKGLSPDTPDGLSKVTKTL